MSTTHTMFFERLRSALTGGHSPVGEPRATACMCVCEHSIRAWEAAPGSTFVVDPDSKLLWHSTLEVMDGSDLSSAISATFDISLSANNQAKISDAIKSSADSGDPVTLMVDGNCAASQVQRSFKVHCAPLSKCSHKSCAGVIALNFMAAPRKSETSACEVQAQILQLQKSAEEFGRQLSLDRSTEEVQHPELMDLACVIRASGIPNSADGNIALRSVELSASEDLPEISAIKSDWQSLLRHLLQTDPSIHENSAPGSLSTPEIALSRKARTIEFEYYRTFNTAPATEMREVVEKAAQKVGKIKSMDITHNNFSLKLVVPINAGIVAPELSNIEERIRRLHVPANANINKNPIPRTRKTG